MEGLEIHFSAANFAVKKKKRSLHQNEFPEKIEKWQKNLERFYCYNPDYETGVVQFGSPILKTESYTYVLSSGNLLEDVLITKNAKRGLMWLKASVNEVRSGMSMGKKYIRLRFVQTYYIDNKKNITLLFDDDDWLRQDKVDAAIDFVLQQEKGNLLENLNWRFFSYKGCSDIGRIVKYQSAQGLKFLVSTASSGAFLNLTEDEIKIGEIVPQNRSFAGALLRYQRTTTGLMRI